MEDPLKEARAKAQEILENAHKIAQDLILNSKDITETNSIQTIRDSVGEINKLSTEHKLLLDLTRLNFICNRIDNTDKNIAAINDKLDGYPIVKSIVIGACAFILIAFLGGLTYLVFKYNVRNT